MNEEQKKDWTDAWHHATYLTSGRNVDTSILAVGMMFQGTLETALAAWVNRTVMKMKRGS